MKRKARTVDVPDLSGPTARLCFEQNTNLNKPTATLLARCDRKRFHRGPHTWQFIDDLAALKARAQ